MQVRATLKLTNVSTVAKHVQVLPPPSQEEFFVMRKLSKSAGALPRNVDVDVSTPVGSDISATGNLAPGLSCLVEVQFTPNHLGDVAAALKVVPEGTRVCAHCKPWHSFGMLPVYTWIGYCLRER